MSLVDKLKNLIDFKLSKVLDDPEASSFAAEKAQEKAEEESVDKQVKDKEAAKKAEADRIIALEASKPPTPAKAAWNNFKKIFVYGLAGFFSTILGSMCANAAIHRHPLIRLLMFIYGSIVGTLLLIFSIGLWFIPFIVLIIFIFLYTTQGLPHLYTYLPLSTYQSPNKIISLLLSLFTYDPNSENNKGHILNKKSDYQGILKAALAVAAAPSDKEEAS
jgi:hypothetical protein